jgi:hypothetical protein
VDHGNIIDNGTVSHIQKSRKVREVYHIRV